MVDVLASLVVQRLRNAVANVVEVHHLPKSAAANVVVNVIRLNHDFL